MSTMYLLVGILGSGKTTYAKDFAEDNPNTKIVCADDFRKMLNGEYHYHKELDDIITVSMVDTIKHLLDGGYDVIVDVGNLTEDRRSSWMQIPVDKRVAVVFPLRDKEWHINNRLKNEHRTDADWDEIYDGDVKAFQPIDKTQFNEVIIVKGY